MPVPVELQGRHKAISILTVTKAYENDDDEYVIEGMATTPTPDRFGDVVEPTGARFDLPSLRLCMQHDTVDPVGFITSAEVSAEGIRIVAKLAKNSGLGYVEKAWKQIKSGLVRGLSIGFRVLKAAIIDDVRMTFRYIEWELLEISAVTVPANFEATIENVKRFDQPARAAASGSTSRSVVTDSSGASAAHQPATFKGRSMTIPITEKIQAKQAELARHRKQMTELSDSLSPDNKLSPEQQESIDQLNLKIEECTGDLQRFATIERSLAFSADASREASQIPVVNGNGTLPATRPPGYVANQYGGPTREKGQLIRRQATCALIGFFEGKGIDVVRAERYPQDRELDTIIKAAINPAMTTVAGWAAELVQTAMAEFLETLQPLSVYARLSTMGVSLTFGPDRGAIKLPAYASTPTLSGGFVAEGMPIRVGRFSLTSATLTPHMMAVISEFTRQMQRYSTPNIEKLVREKMDIDTAVTIDKCLLDAEPVSAARPAGLLNGVTGVPSSGTTPANILTDLRAALTTLSNSNSLRAPVWLLNPQRVFGLSTVMTAAGGFVWRDELAQGRLAGFPFIASNSVPADLVVLLDAADFATATNDSPEFLVSEDATIHEDDGLPFTNTGVTNTSVKPISSVGTPNTVAAPTRSLFQTATIAVRMIMDMDWAMRRTGVVAAITGVAW